MASSNYTYLDNAGIIVPDTSDIKDTVQTEYQTALGLELSLDDSTPQGRMIDIETNARTDVITNNALMANLFNIKMAYGLALDALGANFGLERRAATSSIVTATVTGTYGTVIPAGATASTQAGDIFYAENNITIPVSGSITATFLSVEKGEIPCPANSLTKIIDGTLGWETITNADPAVLGQVKESDASFKAKFDNNGLFTGASILEDYKNELSKVENVISSFVYDNGSGTTITYDTVSIAPHSVYACVDGGTNADVAYALFRRKSTGSAWAGTGVTQTVQDSVYGVNYTVKFDRPTQITIYYDVEYDVGTSAASDPGQAIKDAILEYTNTLKVGDDVLPLQVAYAINQAVSGIMLTSLKLGTVPGSLSTSDVTIRINQVAKTASANITVTMND